MIQDYQNLKYSVTKFPQNEVGQIQKIFSTARYLAFSVRLPGRTVWLFLGRGAGFEGVWIGDKAPESKLRVRDKLCDYVRRYITSSLFLGIELDESDRIVRIKYQKWGKVCSFYYFYKGREAYFINDFQEEDGRRVYSSWRSYLPESENVYQYFDKIGRSKLERRDNVLKDTSIYDLLEKEEKSRLDNVKKKKKKASRKVENIKKDFLKVNGFINFQDVLDSWKLKLSHGEQVKDLDGKHVNIAGKRVKFYGDMSPFQKVEFLYNKRKGLLGVFDKLKKRLAEAEAAVTQNEESLVLRKNIINPVWEVKKEIKEVESSDVAKEYNLYHEEALVIAIGKSAKGNDELRSKWAKKNDWWFHLENMPSAHAYVKMGDNLSLDQGLIRLIAIKLAEQTKYESSQIPIIYSQVKNIKGVKGKPGSVFFKKEKRINIFKDA